MRVAGSSASRPGVANDHQLHAEDRPPQRRQHARRDHRPRPRPHRDALGLHQRGDIRLGAAQSVRPHHRPQRGRRLPQQRRAVGLAAHRAFARRGFDRGHRLGPGLDDADQGASRQPPAPHPLVVVPAFHLREHGRQGIAQPLGRPASDLQLGSHLVERQTGAGRRQVTGEAQQALRGFVAHGTMLPAPGRHRNHSPVQATKPIGSRPPIRPSHSAASSRSSVAGSDIASRSPPHGGAPGKNPPASACAARPAPPARPCRRSAGRPAAPAPWSANRTAA